MQMARHDDVPRPPRHLDDSRQTGFENEGGQFVEEGGSASLPAKLDRYGQARHRAEAILGHLDGLGKIEGKDQIRERAADRLRHCGEYLLFRHYYTVDEVRLHAAHFCQQHLLCPLCAIRRSSKQMGAYLGRYEAIMAQAPMLRPVFITYTVKNGADLRERMTHLRMGLRRLTERRRKSRSNARGYQSTWGNIAGAVGALEATYNPDTGWHPHMHMVALCDGWMDQKAMADEWLRITGDSFIVGIQALDKTKPAVDAFLETFKYAVKFSGLQPAQVWEAGQALKGQRLLFSLGDFRGIKDPTSLTDEPIEDLPFFEFFYSYIGDGHYSLGDTRS